MDENTKKALDKAKTKRKTLRRLTTQVVNRICELLEQDIVDTKSLEECDMNLQEKADQMFKLDSEIENLIPEVSDLETEVENNQEYRESIIYAKSKVKNYLQNSDRNKGDFSLKNNSSLTSNSEPDKPRINLPKLHVEPFEGNLEKFQEFWSQFDNAIHSNERLSKVDKYNYLKAFLKGPALISIQGLLVSENNYDLAVELLKERYGKKEIIVRSHINHLLNLSAVKSASYLKQLRELYDTIEIQVRGLQTLGVELNSYGSLLFPLLTKLIPDSIVLDFYRQHEKDDSWNVTELLKFLRREIETRERTFLFRQTRENNESVKSVDYKLSVNKFSEKGNRFQKFKGKQQDSIPNATALSTFQKICIFLQ
ncbi:uncharacterized protein LOC118203642 [Stegodyphus dumicola]|uniref:uncharacterized protein LOC118203642 n=1 Tax=Stegodyphus dumicola TaxID=202533 RepID=UPI0015AF142E|nr:uncharacterized protein LOC118203642 [Stegodyphus dumicola]